jgi:peptidyl-tRNA hydrolase, PTH1 family
MKLIVGLGNPGQEYDLTRHNVGFLILDYLAEMLKIKYRKGRYMLAAIHKNRAVLIKPQTFMNLSGKAVLEAAKQYPISDTIVVYDDIYLPSGEIRIREKGSDGGHKGIRSIVEELGHGEFARLRIGIGSPQKEELSDYVLNPFADKEVKMLNETFDFCGLLLQEFIGRDYKAMIDCYSRNVKTYSGKIEEYRDQRPKEEKDE